ARDPNLRDVHPVHPGSERGAGAEEALPPPGGRGSLARHRALGSGGSDGQSVGGVRSGRADHRGAPAAGGGAVGRAAVAQAVEVRPADARAPPGGGGGGASSLDRDQAAAFAAAVRSSVSRTRSTRAAGVNGFCRNAVPAASTPWRMTASSV